MNKHKNKIRHGGAAQVRIVGGQWRSRRLPVGKSAGLRPTPDRVRESLFNWLGQDLSGWHCIDAFAGTGALGFEAASRGAAQVLLVEQARPQADSLRAISQAWQATAIEVICGHGLRILQQTAAASQDLIFIDPPFEQAAWLEPALTAAAAAIKAQGFVYLESACMLSADLLLPCGLHIHRYLKAGKTHAHLLCRP